MPKAPESTIWMDDALNYIRNHACENISVKDVMRHVDKSRKSLERHFVAVLGKTPKEVIHDERLRAVVAMVDESELAIGELAEKCSFSSHSAFTIYFKRMVGVTPTQYRASKRTAL
ncbi:MAG: AraC family transcriptional regulator [Pirellulaceae bacterium]